MSLRRRAITCFGEALIDLLARPAAAPDQPRHFIEQAGGAPANVAVGVARLGGKACFAGMLSEDLFGDFLLEQLQRHRVDTRQIRRTAAARTALAFVALDAGGERSFNFYRPPAADLLFASTDFDREALAASAVFHVCSNSLTATPIAETTLHGMRFAAEAGAIVSIDLNLRLALWPADVDPLPTLWSALELAHLVKLSHDELVSIAAGSDESLAIARLLAANARIVVVTDGAAPVRWWSRSDQGSAPTFAVDVIDTTAAGDAFVAALLHGLVQHDIDVASLESAFADPDLRASLLACAAAAGACATTRHGAFDALPDPATIEALLQRG